MRELKLAINNFLNSQNKGNACSVARSEIPFLIINEGSRAEDPLSGLAYFFHGGMGKLLHP